jgi:putative nucleotidyltransferase with HDIG domain
VINRDDIIKKIKSVKMIPPVVTQIITAVSTPDFDIKEVAKLVTTDVSLTANILKIVNSPYLGLIDKINTINQAVVVVGSKVLMNLVILTAAEMTAREPVHGYDLAGEDLWKNSLATAIASFTIAEKNKFENSNIAFTAGLLHDMGKIVLGDFIGSDVNEVIRIASENKMTFLEAERKVYGTDHQEISGMMLEYWKFPQILIDSVRYHHEPEKYTAGGVNEKYVYAVHAGDAIALKTGIGTGADGLTYQMNNTAMEKLGLKNSDMEEIMALTIIEFKKMEKDLVQNHPK